MTVQKVRPLLCGALLALTLTKPVLMSAKAESGGKARPKEVVASLWKLSDQEQRLELTTMSQTAPVSTSLSPETQVEGECVHCRITFQFTVGDLSKRCAACPCGSNNIWCLTDQKHDRPTWTALLQGLPRGIQLRVEFVAAERPEAGIKRLVVDRLGALLPVEGLEHATSSQIQALGQAVGATRATLNPEGCRLQLSFKNSWTLATVTRLERELAKLGGRIASPPAAPPAH